MGSIAYEAVGEQLDALDGALQLLQAHVRSGSGAQLLLCSGGKPRMERIHGCGVSATAKNQHG